MCASTMVSRRVLVYPNLLYRNSTLVISKKHIVPHISRLSTSSSCTVQQKVDVLNMKINYEEIGHGPHVILCNPGTYGFIEFDFGPLLSMFPANKFTVVVWEPPGYGRSRPPERDFSGGKARFHRDAMYSNELMKVLYEKTLGYSKYSILGWSEGGITAIIHAAKFPDCVRKLVTIAAFSHIADRDIAILKEIENIDNLTLEMKRPMIQMYGEETFRRMWFAMIQAAMDIYSKGGDMCENDLPNVKCPSLILHGYRDPMIHVGHGEFIHKRIKNSEFHIFPKGKHNLHLKYAYDVMDVILKFLLKDL